MKTTFCLFRATILSITAALTERKITEIGTKPESVCRGFGGKLYFTMLNGVVVTQAYLSW